MRDAMTRIKDRVLSVLHNSRGFTLIELLIVLAIIAIIAGIAIPRYTASFDKAKESACAANIAVLESAVTRYWADHLNEGDVYPANVAALESGGYIKAGLTCPVDKEAVYSINLNDDGSFKDVTCSHAD